MSEIEWKLQTLFVDLHSLDNTNILLVNIFQDNVLEKYDNNPPQKSVK